MAAKSQYVPKLKTVGISRPPTVIRQDLSGVKKLKCSFAEVRKRNHPTGSFIKDFIAAKGVLKIP